MRDMALTITTDQIQGWGIIGCVIIVVITLLVIKMVKSMVGRTVWTIVAIGLLLLAYTQRVSISDSVKQCDPKMLGIHLQISDAGDRAKCEQTLSGTA